MFIRPLFIRALVDGFGIAALSLAAASAATAQSLPEMRMTPTEIDQAAQYYASQP